MPDDETAGSQSDLERGETDVPEAGPGDDAATDLDAGDAPDLDNLETANPHHTGHHTAHGGDA